MNKKNTLLLTFLCCWCYVTAFQGLKQNVIPDSLTNKTYKELNISFGKNIEDTIKSILYADVILAKAKMESDTSQILNGFRLLSLIHKDQDVIFKYADSIIDIGTKVGNDRYVGMSFLNKGSFLFTKRKFNQSLDNFLKAKKYLEDFPKLNYFNEHNIGLLKSRIGDYQDANEIFKKNWEFINDKKPKGYSKSYLSSLFSLSDSYRRIKQYDSASYYFNLGVKESLRFEDQKMYYQFILGEGVNQYYLENYKASHDSIVKVYTNFKDGLDIPNLIIANQYYGKVLMKHNLSDSAIVYFKKVDSLFMVTNDIHPETRDTYEFLINYYKSKNDLPNQLKYVTQLLKVDSVLDKNNKYLSKGISKFYDTPKLILEKEEIIDKLKNKNTIISNRLLITVCLFVISTLGLFYFYYRQRVFKKRFLNLVKKGNNNSRNYLNTKESNISDDVIAGILSKLDEFEKSNGFLDSGVTLNDLSKQFNTNTKYLSKIINSYKHKNFSVYINDLRIHYVVEKIKNDNKFRKYTIKAISSEVGFNTTQAFSKAFHKTTGIYPSYFIRNIEKMIVEN